ncbi:unnamed protein product [Dimorphilus gyrociliatus]|uniref:Lysosomal dipeptide transporter MFSD1 n=1 Tax=Dimorphilus gyrociliatus TaxID=2664684 RepID=A0A7I8W308_9ANNE|nr:unnamed protein product [Dimorphilus gyrociliatus]
MSATEDEQQRLLQPGNNSSDNPEIVIASGCGASLPCDPRRKLHKYLVLIIMCLLSFGSYFVYDNPAALQDVMERDLNLNNEKYMLFYALYSYPNVILCFFGGFLIDRVFGTRLGAIIFSSFVTIGHFLFAAGALVNKPGLMDFGRFVFGIGGESLCVTQNTYAVSWFKGKELNMVFGLQLSLSRVGSTVNMNTMKPLYDHLASFMGIGHHTLGITLFIAGVFCVFSLLCAFAMAFFDKRAERILKKKEALTGETIRISDVKNFPLEVWLLSVICVAYYVTIFPFVDVGLLFYEMKFDQSAKLASLCNSLVYILSAAMSPFTGFAIDKTGRNVFWVIAGVVLTIISHGLLAFTFFNPFIPVVLMGFAYSIVASALWPMASYIVPEYQLGTVYGLMQAIQNLGLATIAQAAGAIVDTKGYLLLEMFFLALLCIALIFSLLLYFVNAYKKGNLNLSTAKRKQLAKLEEKAAQ